MCAVICWHMHHNTGVSTIMLCWLSRHAWWRPKQCCVGMSRHACNQIDCLHVTRYIVLEIRMQEVCKMFVPWFFEEHVWIRSTNSSSILHKAIQQKQECRNTACLLLFSAQTMKCYMWITSMVMMLITDVAGPLSWGSWLKNTRVSVANAVSFLPKHQSEYIHLNLWITCNTFAPTVRNSEPVQHLHSTTHVFWLCMRGQ